MTSKHMFRSGKKHPLLETLEEMEPDVSRYDPSLEVLSMTHFWALTNFIQYGLDCAAKESRQSGSTATTQARDQEWLLDHVEGAVICLQLARDSLDTFISHG